MKRMTCLAVILLMAPLAGAQQLYKYVDKNGRTVYSDQAPANVDSKAIGSTTVSTVAAPPKTAVDKDRELDKGRKEAKEKSEKAEKTAAFNREMEQRCQQARTSLQSYSEGGRMYKYNDKGEREFMSDDDIASGLRKAQRDVDEACKKS